ncbi:hypothetical protein DYD21_15065 [Rhodohalobacter sp. SW132]|uniref:hypothetical protein n=1 Tax=Rhodohalobacter sp. SW132 TaxID=2293433 RepID=UPI000E224B0A|nr:hypothetical protein [Rhodohalobacter sp. SW132]REL29172.1 hypothetical protein DYD21_15065 [Rhodohalobacter sp. SW132]
MENMYLATFSKVVLIVSALLLSLHSSQLFAQTTEAIQTISHQGVLVNESGEPVDDGAYIFTFRIYDTDTEGDHLWRETQVLQVQNGVFNAQLGTEDQLDIPFDRPYWLGIEIDGGEQLAPRMPLSAAPYALHAYSVADGSVNGASLADDALIEGDNISIERNSDGDFVVSAITPDGGLTSITVDSTMIGDGTSDQPLGINLPDGYLTGNLIANQAITGLKIDENTLIEGDNISIERDQDGNFVLTAETPDGGLTSVSVDSTMIGDGTSDQPLGISLPDNYISGNQLKDDISIETSGSIQTESTISSQEGIFAERFFVNPEGNGQFSYLVFRNNTHTANPRMYHSSIDNRIHFSDIDGIRVHGEHRVQDKIYADGGIDVTGNLNLDGQINTTGHLLINTDASSNIAYVIFRGTGPAGNPRLFHREDHDRIAFSGMGEVAIDGDLMVTGAKNFIHPHPHDPSKQIRYTSLEAGESGVYWRGSAATQNGRAVIELPEHFTLVTHEENLTATITPVGSWAPLYVEEVSNTTLVVALEYRFGDLDTEFDFVVYGVRDGFEDYQVLEERSMELMD